MFVLRTAVTFQHVAMKHAASDGLPTPLPSFFNTPPRNSVVSESRTSVFSTKLFLTRLFLSLAPPFAVSLFIFHITVMFSSGIVKDCPKVYVN